MKNFELSASWKTSYFDSVHMDRVLIALTRDLLNKFTNRCEGITKTVLLNNCDTTGERFSDSSKMVKTGQYIMKGDLHYCFRPTCTFVFIFVWCR